MRSDAPWTAEEVDALNRWQACGWVHPFTCGGDRTDRLHESTADDRGEEPGRLVATPDGWVCPACGYRQTWAHDFMLGGPPPHPLAAANDRRS